MVAPSLLCEVPCPKESTYTDQDRSREIVQLIKAGLFPFFAISTNGSYHRPGHVPSVLHNYLHLPLSIAKSLGVFS